MSPSYCQYCCSMNQLVHALSNNWIWPTKNREESPITDQPKLSLSLHSNRATHVHGPISTGDKALDENRAHSQWLFIWIRKTHIIICASIRFTDTICGLCNHRHHWWIYQVWWTVNWCNQLLLLGVIGSRVSRWKFSFPWIVATIVLISWPRGKSKMRWRESTMR